MSRFFDPTNDIAFKKLFTTVENKPLLINLLNTLLKREGEDQIQEVDILPTELLPHIPEAKNSLVDIRCTDKKNFQYIVEIQNKVLSSFLQRAQYYTAKAYGSQLVQGDDYLELKPVILLAILKNNLFPNHIHYISYHHTLETQTHENYLKDISYVFVELGKFNKAEKDLQTVEDYWIHLFKEAAKENHIPENSPPPIKRAYDVLEQYNWTEIEKIAYDRSTMADMDARDERNTAIKAAEAKARESGIQETLVNLACKWLKQGRSIEDIMEDTGLSLEQIRNLENNK